MRPRSVPLALAAVLCAAGATLATAPSASAATGDQRTVAQPSLPSTCRTVTSDLAAPAGRTFSGSQEADPPDTSRIQSALDACKGSGKAVVLAPGGSDQAFLSAPLTIGGGEYLVLDAGVTLFASRNASDYQASSGATCGTLSSSTSSGCNPFIAVSGSDSGIEGTQSSGHQGTIDGRGDLDILGTSTSWWANATAAKSAGKKQVNPRLIQADRANGFTVYDINLVDAAKQHLYYKSGTGLTVWGLRIRTPATARNTDGIDIDSSTDATVNESYISAGDDCVALETNASASSHTTIENTHCYGTHGISIGSETTYGVTSVLVQHNTVQGTDYAGRASTSPNGLRIKSYAKAGGTVSTIRYYTNCMTRLKYPLDFDPFYSSSTGSHYPYFKDVVVYKATSTGSLSGAKSVLEGYSSGYPLGLTLEDVDLDTAAYASEYAHVQLYNSDVVPSGTGVTVTGFTGSGSAPSCSFPGFPSL